MNVCFLLGGFQSNGGIGRVTSILANALSEQKNITIHTVAYCHTRRPMLYTLSEQVHQHHLFTAPTPMVKAILLGNAITKLREILVQEHIDVLVAAGALFYPLAILASRGTATKCICWEHTNPASTADHRFQGWCRRYAVRRTHKLVVLTRSAAQYYTETLKIKPEKLVQIYNPIDPVENPAVYDDTATRMIAVGRLAYPKHFDRLISIAARCLKDHPQWSLDIYGKGEDRPKLEKQIHSLGMEGRIHLMGQVDDLYDRYSQYAFQVMTSRYEGFPMSLLEGGSHRLPLIAFNVPTGPDEIIVDGENGFLVDAHDDARMESCILRLMNDPALRQQMSETSYRLARRFHMSDILNQWCEIL